MSYETYALVSDIVSAHPLPAITMKGIAREIVPYSVESIADSSTEKSNVIVERVPGLDFYFDPSIAKSSDPARVRSVLENALSALETV